MLYRIETVPDARTTTIEKPEEKSASGKRLLCKLCGRYITSPNERIAMSGKNTHVFTNPAGYVFQIGCFSTASGCIITGEPTEEYTWFPSHAWSYALCAGCLEHLGWFYESGTDSFFGLILNRLREEEGD
jgi:hypothetical protein